MAHKRCTTLHELQSLRGSKYVQSRLDGVFRQVAEDLPSGRRVLFSGTPCQVAGLRSFLKKSRIPEDNLLTTDIICHGVPSPELWKGNLAYLSTIHGSPVATANFRDKKAFGWHSHIETYRTADGQKFSSDLYTCVFYKHLSLRPSCGDCHFCNLARPSDLTFGDFWGLAPLKPEMDADNKGMSLILVNTGRGLEALDSADDLFQTFLVTDKSYMQPNLRHPSEIPPEADEFREYFLRRGAAKALLKYGRPSFPQRLWNRIVKIKKMFIKRVLIK